MKMISKVSWIGRKSGYKRVHEIAPVRMIFVGENTRHQIICGTLQWRMSCTKHILVWKYSYWWPFWHFKRTRFFFRTPYNNANIRSIYHVCEYDIHEIFQIGNNHFVTRYSILTKLTWSLFYFTMTVPPYDPTQGRTTNTTSFGHVHNPQRKAFQHEPFWFYNDNPTLWSHSRKDNQYNVSWPCS